MWLLFLQLFLLLQILPSQSDSENDGKPHYHLKKRAEALKKKVCGPPVVSDSVLAKFDACGASLLFGRTNVRNCFTKHFSFKKRVTLREMYTIDCMLDDEGRKKTNKALSDCLMAIAKITPKDEFTQFEKKMKSFKTDEEKMAFTKNYTDARLSCEEAALKG